MTLARKNETYMIAPSYIWQQWLAMASGTFAVVLSNTSSHSLFLQKAATNLTSNQRNLGLADRLKHQLSLHQLKYQNLYREWLQPRRNHLPLKYFCSLCTSAQQCAITHAASAPGALFVLVSTSIWKCRNLSKKLIPSSLLDQRVEGN